MKELTREELPDDGTHFVVTWTFLGKHHCRTGSKACDEVLIYSDQMEMFFKPSFLDRTNIRFWQFPEGETK